MSDGAPPIAADRWRALSPSAQRVLAALADTLSGGFTGKIELSCIQGGVTSGVATTIVRLDHSRAGK